MGHLLTEAAALPAEVVEEIVKRTDGVPLFLEEVTKVVPETALTNTAGGAIAVLPSSIGGAPDLQASLMARLDRRVAGHPLSALLSHRVSRLRARTVCPIGDLAGGSEPAELGGNASFVQLLPYGIGAPIAAVRLPTCSRRQATGGRYLD